MKNEKLKVGFVNYNVDKTKEIEDILDLRVDTIDMRKLDLIKDYDVVFAMGYTAGEVREYCDKYNIPLISLNPITYKDDPYKLTEAIFFCKDDEHVDAKETLEFCKTRNIFYRYLNTGGHKFENLSKIKESIDEFLAHAILYK